MFIATLVVTIIFSLILIGSAAGKLTKNPKIIEGITRVGVPEDRIWQLAVLELLGAAGLLIGLFWWPLGVLAGVCTVLYFVGAVASHIRASDAKNAPAPAVILLIAVAATVLRIASH